MPLAARHHAPLPAHARPHDLAPLLVDALGAVDARLRRAWNALTPEQRDAPRHDGGWSLRAVLEHVVLTNEGYLPRLTVLADTLPRSSSGAVPWRPTFVGKWLVRSLEMTIPMPAPKTIQPGPAARPDVLDAVVSSHRVVGTLVLRHADSDWRSGRMVSPFNRLVRLNFGDAVLAVLRHSERHTAQIESLVRELTHGG